VAIDLDLLAKACAVAGMGLWLWPMVQRLRGHAPAGTAGAWAQIRSPLWWCGFVLICLALLFQRLAAQQTGG
jgi:hypothetical protein